MFKKLGCANLCYPTAPKKNITLIPRLSLGCNHLLDKHVHRVVRVKAKHLSTWRLADGEQRLIDDGDLQMAAHPTGPSDRNKQSGG